MEGSAADNGSEKTQYRVLMGIDLETEKGATVAEIIKDLADKGVEGGALCVLLPDTFEGNVFKSAHAKHGDGTYGKFPARGFALKPVAVQAVVKVG